MTTDTTTDTTAEVPSSASRALSATVEYLRRSGDDVAARALQATLDERRSPGMVCLVGRAGAGRSSLLNALVGSPAALPASPAGVGTVTTAPVSVDLDPGAGESARPVSFTDVPGIGVTSSGPDGTADLYLTRADTALFVVDAHTPLNDTEVTALGDALRLAPAVELVVTKRDQNFRTLDAVLARNREAMSTVAPDVPVHVVSALPGINDSGLTALRDRIMSRVSADDTREHAADAALRQARILVDREIDRQRLLADVTAAPDDTVAGIDARLRELTDLAKDNRTFLSDRIAAARGRAIARHTEELADLQKRWRHHIDTTRPAQILADPEPVVARLSAELSRLKQNALGRLMRAVRGDFLEFTEGSGRWEAVTRRIESTWSTATDGSPGRGGGTAPEKARFSELVSPSLLTVTVSGGGALAYAASLLPGVGGVIAATGGLAAAPVVAVAGGWLAVNLLHTAAGKGRRNLRTWLNETATAARQDLSRDLDEVFHQLRPVVLVQYQKDITAYVSTEKKQLTAAKASLLAGQKDADNTRDLALRRVAHLTRIKEMLA